MDDMQLPPGAALVSPGSSMALPPGATLAPPPTPEAKPGKTLWETLGGPQVVDFLKGGQSALDLVHGKVTDPSKIFGAINTLKGVVAGAQNELMNVHNDGTVTRGRIVSELANAGSAMVHGDIPLAAHHLAGAFPMIGKNAQDFEQDIREGKYRQGAERAVGTALPFATGEVGSAVDTAASKAAEVAPRAIRAARVAAPQVAGGMATVGAGEVLGGVPGLGTIARIGLDLPGASMVGKGLKAGYRDFMATGARAEAERAAAESAAREANLGGTQTAMGPPPAQATPATPGQALASASNVPWDDLAPAEKAMFESSAAEQARQRAAASAPRAPMGPPAAPSAQGEALAPSAPGRTVAQMIQDEFNARQGATEPAAQPQATQGPPEMIGAHKVTPLESGKGAPLRPPLAQLTKPQIIEAAGLPKDAPLAQVEAAVNADQAARAAEPLADPSRPIEPTVEASPDKKTVTLYSWSNEPRETLDPSKFGTGKPGAELTRRTRGGWGDQFPNRLSYWDTPEANERGFGPGTERPVRHMVEVPADKVYDLGTDPDGFRQKAGGDVTQAEIDLKKAGFSGYSYNLGGKNVYAIFDEQKPHTIEKFGADYSSPEAVKSPAAQSVAPKPPGKPRPSQEIQALSNQYTDARGMEPVNHKPAPPVDEAFAKRTAAAYDNLKADNSADPKVRAAYKALADETSAQFQQLKAAGYKMEPWTKEGQPYANSTEMAADLKNNKHLYYFTGGEEHPLLGKVDPETGIVYNDMFRAVHDVYGHAAPGNGFGPRGEEGAFQVHSQMYSPEARQAMATETRGQNSWVNFGKHNYGPGGEPLNIPATERPFAQQKVDLLPEEMQQSSVAKTRTLAQTESAMAQKKPAQVDLQEAQSATAATGERKSQQMRGAERTAQNVDAKAQRWADAFKSEGMTAEDVGNMQKQDFEVMRNGLIAKGKLPEGEVIPNTSIDAIVKKMKEPAPGGGMGALKNNFNPEPGKVQGGFIAESLQKTADDATQRLRDRGAFGGGKLNANFPAEDFKDMATWGAAKLAKGTVDLASWSKEMLADAGAAADKLRPMLPDMFAKSQKILEKHIANTLEGGLPTTEKLLEMYRAGEEGKDWYKYTQGELENHFGTDAPMFVDFLAATSPNASVKSNVALALKAYQQWKSGEDFSGYMPAVKGNLERAVQGIPPSGPKVTSFKANLFGNTEAVTVDRWISRAMNWKRDSLTPDQYKFIDYNLTQVAKEAGVEPRQIQAAIWKAIKDAQGRSGDTGASFEQAIKDKMAKSPEFKALIEKLKQGDSGLGGHA